MKTSWRATFLAILLLITATTAACTSAGNENNAGDPAATTPATAVVPPEPTATEIAPAATATATVAPTPEVDPQTALLAAIEDVLANQGAGLEAVLSPEFGYGLWRSEWQTGSPADAAAAIMPWLPRTQPTSTVLLADEPADFLDGQNPYLMLGPDVTVAVALRSQGWGEDGAGEAVLFITSDDGLFYAWQAVLYAPAGFQAAPPIVAAPAGITFRRDGATWTVAADGELVQVSDQEVFPSPGLTRAVFIDWAVSNQELLVIDLAGGGTSTITLSGRWVSCFGWQDETHALCSMRHEDEEDSPSLGHLAIVDVISGAIVIPLPDSSLSSLPAVSPDGATLAFSGGGTFFWRDETLTPFEWLDLPGLPDPVQSGLSSPAFAPDGQRIAWILGGSPTHLVIFDLSANTAQVLFSFDPLGFGGFFPAAEWSPDGQWLAVQVLSSDPDVAGLWLLAADGSESIRLGDSYLATPVWIDADQLLYTNIDRPSTIWSYTPSNDSHAQVALPEGSMLFGHRQ